MTASLREILPGDKAKFLRQDGVEFEIGFDRFSSSDQDRLRKHQGPKP